MINRKVYELLKQHDSREYVLPNQLNVAAEDMDLALHNLALNLYERINNSNSLSVIDYNSEYDNYDNLGMLDFRVSENEIFYMTLSSNKLVYGFATKYFGKLLDALNNKDIDILKKRYFRSLIIKTQVEGYAELSGEFEVNIRQLNSRDFWAYTVFIFEKCLKVSRAIRNNSSNLKKAV